MRWAPAVEGYGVRLRAAAIEDAEFVLSLRLDPELGAFLGDTSPDVAAQRAWMAAQVEREGDLFFVVETARGERVGTVGIYDIRGGQAEWGRWVVRRGSPAAVASVLLTYQIAFDVLGLDRVRCRTVAGNARALSFQDNCGLVRAGVEPRAVRLRGEEHDLVRHELTRLRWPGVREQLAPVASAAARFLE